MAESTNPFLMSGFESARTENVFNNPFALPDDGNAAASNPFLTAATGAGNLFTQPSTYTNPFAQFLVDESTPAPAPAPAPVPAPAPTPISFFDPPHSKPTDLFSASQPSSKNVTDLSAMALSDTPRSGSRKSSLAGYESDSDKRSPPRRPPPPRPNPPSVPGSRPGSVPGTPGPAKETKDLILSVTGALEATSTDLLDRLQATRTPSPTPLRDLASPSPTNVMEVNDLLGDDTQVPRHPHATTYPDIQREAMNIFDAIANLSREQENKADSTPVPATPPFAVTTPPNRPPPPQISSQTGSPYMSRKSSLISETSRRTSIDVKETPPLPRPPLPITIAEPEVDRPLLRQQSRGSGDGAQNLLASKDLPANYVAMRKASHDITANRMQTLPTRKKYSLDYSGAMGEQSVIREQLEQHSNDFTTPPTSSIAGSNHIDNAAPILEAPKFQVISTTPIMSYENIASENLYGEQVEKEPRLIFEEAAEKATPSSSSAIHNSFAVSTPDPFASAAFKAPVSDLFVTDMNASSQSRDDFDDFSEKFDNVKGKDKETSSTSSAFDPFGDNTAAVSTHDGGGFSADGFGNEAPFDEFLAMTQPQTDQQWPQTEVAPPSSFHQDFSPATKVAKTDSVETPPTPLFDEDVSQPLEPFPRTSYTGPGWEMLIRYPIRKKFTGQRFWKKVFVKLVYQGETPHIELFSKDESKETLLHEWPLQPCYAISDIGAQQYDQYGKVFTVKIQFVMYKERPGVRPGQVTKAERLTNKLSQFAAYAIQGDYQGVKEFGSDLKKLGLPVEHSPQISLICKLGSHSYEDMKQFSICVEDALFKLPAHRDNIHVNYKMEEVQITAVDELYVEQNSSGSILKQIARVRLFFLGFLTGMPDIEIGVNDLWRQGKEVVGRHDIIPVETEEWIRLENLEFHSCIPQNIYEETRIIKVLQSEVQNFCNKYIKAFIKSDSNYSTLLLQPVKSFSYRIDHEKTFKPPDQCYLELMRFRVRPPKNRELPLQVKTVFRICGNKVDIYSDILVPGFTSRKLGQIPCEDIAVRIPIPECWIYLFRTEKHFRYGSVKSAHRRTGKVKGIERFLGAIDTLEQHLIEVTSGHAKYEHHHRAIVWRIARLPKEGQGAYTTHNLVCHLALTSYDQVPKELAQHFFVEFTMPVTQVSHFTVRSVSVCNSDSDSPPEKCVKHLARHEYKIEIEQTHSESTNDYLAATMVKKPTAPVNTKPATIEPLEPVPDTDSDGSE